MVVMIVTTPPPAAGAEPPEEEGQEDEEGDDTNDDAGDGAARYAAVVIVRLADYWDDGGGRGCRGNARGRREDGGGNGIGHARSLGVDYRGVLGRDIAGRHGAVVGRGRNGAIVLTVFENGGGGWGSCRCRGHWRWRCELLEVGEEFGSVYVGNPEIQWKGGHCVRCLSLALLLLVFWNPLFLSLFFGADCAGTRC